jgi:hypothetical protein
MTLPDRRTLDHRASDALVEAERRLEERRGSEGPPCTHCGATQSRVVDRKPPKRRRECVECGRRFNTKEMVDDAA